MKKILIFSLIALTLGFCSSNYKDMQTPPEATEQKKEERKNMIQRMEAMQALSSKDLVSKIDSTDELEALSAARLIGLRRDLNVREDLEKYLSTEGKSEAVKAEIAVSLGRIGSKDSAVILEKTLKDTNPESQPNISNKATESMGKIGSNTSKTAIEIKMKSSKSKLKVVGQNAISRIDESSNSNFWHNDKKIKLYELPDYIIKNMEFQKNKKDIVFSILPCYLLPKIVIAPISQEFTGEMATALKKEGYKVVTPDKIKEVMDLQYIQSSDFYEDDFKTSVGHLVGANTILTGTFTPYESLDGKFVRARIEIIDVETGLILVALGVNIIFDVNVENLTLIKENSDTKSK